MRKSVITSAVLSALIVLGGAQSASAEFTASTSAVSVVSSPSVGQLNALRKAKEYLALTSFSRSGLIKQLKFEGFTASQAKYGVDATHANWKKQAAKKAKEYLSIMSFSRSGLITQLEFEGFTHSQAKYGVSKTGL